MKESPSEILKRKAIDKRIPVSVHFDLTHHCNLNCVHCYVVPKNQIELKTIEVKNILCQLAKAGTLYLTLSGGEILTRKDFFEIALYARKLSFSLRLLTNGTLVDERVADKIADLNPENVAISIYSTNPKIYDRITRETSSFQKSLSGVKKLRNRGVRVKISTIIMRYNKNDYRTVYELAKKLGATFQADYRITPRSNGDKSPLRFGVSEKDLHKIGADTIFSRENQLENEIQESHSSIFNTIPCGAGHSSCYISPYGNLYPCVQFPVDCGNLREDSFVKIWKHSSQMKKVYSMTISDLPKCSGCSLLPYCRLCIGLNYNKKKDVFYPFRGACKEARVMKKLGKKWR